MKILRTIVKSGLSLLIAVLLFNACDDDPVVTSVSGHQYFPLKLNDVKVYRMDSVIYNIGIAGLVRDTLTHYRREEVIEIIDNDRGDVEFKIEISKRSSLNTPWVMTHLVNGIRSVNQLQWAELNLRFIKLIFPTIINESWDGLSFINRNVELNINGNVFRPFLSWKNHKNVANAERITTPAGEFDNVLHVEESRDENDIQLLVESTAYYALGTGLIKRSQRILGLNCQGTPQSPCHDPNDVWEDDAEFGYTLVQTLISTTL